MSSKKLFWTGGTGSVITAICCFTPVLVILFPAVGLGAWLSWIDYVLFPALALFLGIMLYAAMRLMRERRECCEIPATQRSEGGQS